MMLGKLQASHVGHACTAAVATVHASVSNQSAALQPAATKQDSTYRAALRQSRTWRRLAHTQLQGTLSMCKLTCKTQPTQNRLNKDEIFANAGDRAALTAAVPQQPTPTAVPPADLRFFKCARTHSKPAAPPCFGGASQHCSLHLHTHPPGSPQRTCWFTTGTTSLHHHWWCNSQQGS
jgi:hypothetical protein